MINQYEYIGWHVEYAVKIILRRTTENWCDKFKNSRTNITGDKKTVHVNNNS